MLPIIPTSVMRSIDRQTIDEWGLPSLALMETAGVSIFKYIQILLPNLAHKSILIMCGKGNNAGDGLVIARMLLGVHAKVKVIMSHQLEKMSPDAQFNHSMLTKMGFLTASYNSSIGLKLKNEPWHLIIDALLGTGFNGEVHGVLNEMIQLINELRFPVLSIDLPSGMNADVVGKETCVKAQYTVSIGCPQPSMFFSPHREHIGKLSNEPIGFPHTLIESTSYFFINQKARSWKVSRSSDSHKGQCGKILICAGSPGMVGAGILCAKAAIKAGSSMVQIVCEKEILPIYQQACPEATVLQVDIRQKSSFEQFIQRCHDWADAVIVGPGLGKSDAIKNWVTQIIKSTPTPLLIDADGLNAIDGQAELLKDREQATILTPHPGEFERVFKTKPKTNGLPVMEQCRQLAGQHHLTLHLKGAPSLTATQDGNVMINGSGNSILSTAGSGDILSGITGALLAQGFSADKAMVAAAYWHGQCADILKKEAGVIGHSTIDILNQIPNVINA